MYKVKLIDSHLIVVNDTIIDSYNLTTEQVKDFYDFIEESTDLSENALRKGVEDILLKKQTRVVLNEEKFVQKEKVYLKDYNIEVPNAFLKVFNGDLSSNYINFLKLLQLNPIEAIRKKLPQYIVDNNLRITDNGYIVGCRQVWKVKNNNEEIEKIKDLYHKVKNKWKKSPSKTVLDTNNNIVTVGGIVTLQEKYDEVKDFSNTTYYTSDYTQKERWEVGGIMDVGKRSLDNTELSCGSDMLHIRSNPKELDSYGDTNIMVIINPQDVVSCKERWKFGVYKCYFASIMNEEDVDLFNAPLQDFEHDYMEHEWNIVEESLKKVSQSTFAGEVISIDPEDYKKIIEERRVVLNK